MYSDKSIWQEAEWRWRGREWWEWGERTGGAPNREKTSIFFLFKRINMWYHDALRYFLSIYVRFGQFTFGPVKFSYVLAQSSKFQSQWLLTCVSLGVNTA